eukprot:TRINITY_DN14604_c0_g1_i1.p1 TRINITY_DN14604_c0_g1~~TRINITY_DN14604_c0_g1_i1.p1  ORF type:complete len:344 (-),score=39.23 TRINITY_DN14604_c0_g1_i1:14-1015(-)
MLGNSMQRKTEALKPVVDTLLFAYRTFTELKEAVLLLPEAQTFMRAGGLDWNKFADGFPDIMIHDVSLLTGRHCVVLIDLLDKASMFEQLALIYMLPRYFCRSLTVLLPYFPTGTMERIDEEGQVATAMTLARLLSAIPLTPCGPARLVMWDIHALQERFYFDQHIVPMFRTATPLIIKRLRRLGDPNIVIAFPDDGALKRFGKGYKDHFNLAVCSKVRDGDKRIITVTEGNVKDCHVVIVDDLVKTGGTLIQCKNALIKLGAKAVSAFVTHAVFPQESWRKFLPTPDGNNWKYFWTTDSCPTVTSVIKDHAPFEILSLKGEVLQVIRDTSSD